MTELRILSAGQVETETLQALGFDGTSFKLEAYEAIAALIRRAASHLCPCSTRLLVGTVFDSLVHLFKDRDWLQTTLESIVEELIAIGDLQEHRNVNENKTFTLYLAPPSFIPLSGGTTVIIGITPDNTSFLPENVERNVIYKNCLRYTRKELTTEMTVGDESVLSRDEELADYLTQLGLVKISEENWLNAPPDESTSSHINRFEHLLDLVGESVDFPDFSILNTSKDVHYYRGRWSSPKNLSGRFVGRRPQSYGNDIWCYTEVLEGKVKKFIDLPLISSVGLRGCDEAWHLQAALDAHRGNPQQYKLRKITQDTYAIDIFSPIPCWIKRRWNWLGKRVDSTGCLMSFQFMEIQIKQEMDFIQRKLWCVELEG